MGKYGYPRMPDCLQSVHKDIAALVNENNYNTTRNARHRNSADVLPNNQLIMGPGAQNVNGQLGLQPLIFGSSYLCQLIVNPLISAYSVAHL